MTEKKKGPVSDEVLIQTLEVKSLRNACIVIITNDIVESNLYEPVNIASSRRMLELALDPAAHLGRTNAASLLHGLVEAGLLSDGEEEALWYVAGLIEQEEGSLEIDPLLEVARRVLKLQLARGGRRG